MFQDLCGRNAANARHEAGAQTAHNRSGRREAGRGGARHRAIVGGSTRALRILCAAGRERRQRQRLFGELAAPHRFSEDTVSILLTRSFASLLMLSHHGEGKSYLRRPSARVVAPVIHA